MLCNPYCGHFGSMDSLVFLAVDVNAAAMMKAMKAKAMKAKTMKAKAAMKAKTKKAKAMKAPKAKAMKAGMKAAMKAKTTKATKAKAMKAKTMKATKVHFSHEDLQECELLRAVLRSRGIDTGVPNFWSAFCSSSGVPH